MAGLSRRTLLLSGAIVFGGAIASWLYYQSLVPAIHQDHDHGLDNLVGGGFLRIESRDGSRRNLVGKPNKVLILHWFRPDRPEELKEWPALRSYAASVAADPMIEIVLVAAETNWTALDSWAAANQAPSDRLYLDPKGETGRLIGVRRYPETFVYDPEGHLAHQARGAMDWGSLEVRAAIEGFKKGSGEHQH